MSSEASPTLEEFNSVVTHLGETYLALDNVLTKIPNFSNFHRQRTAHHAFDIIAFAPILRDLHVEVTKLVLEDEYKATILANMFPDIWDFDSLSPEDLPRIKARLQEYWEASERIYGRERMFGSTVRLSPTEGGRGVGSWDDRTRKHPNTTSARKYSMCGSTM